MFSYYIYTDFKKVNFTEMKTLQTLIFLFFTFGIYAQNYPDFTITDTNGETHHLYEDYLNHNKVVVIKLFFVACPPCNAIAPDFQAKYEEWGEGNGNVEFFELSTQTWDNNSDVASYKQQHGITAPGAGTDGGGRNAVLPIITGQFGSYFGTPSFAIIAPDGSVQYPVFLNDEMNPAIEAALELESPYTSFNTNVNIQANGVTPNDAYNFILKSASSSTPTLNITNQVNNGSFYYPPSGFENVNDPIIVLESLSSAPHPSLTASDLSAIQKHILGLKIFDNEAKVIASDVNGSGTLSASDLSLLQKLILNLIDQLPENVPGYFLYPSEIEVPISSGQNETLEINVYRMGNVNF